MAINVSVGRKVDEKSCETFLLCDPGWCVHKSDVQNKWDGCSEGFDVFKFFLNNAGFLPDIYF